MDLHQFSINGLLVNVALGSCASYNIIYHIMCTFPNCKECYTGRSVRALRVRIGEHRRAFCQILDVKAVDPENDDFSPGLHLKEQNCNDNGYFNKFLRVCLLEICSLISKYRVFIYESHDQCRCFDWNILFREIE